MAVSTQYIVLGATGIYVQYLYRTGMLILGTGMANTCTVQVPVLSTGTGMSIPLLYLTIYSLKYRLEYVI